MLLTRQPLSIQVHPDDAYAQSIGLPNGKTEAWYVVSAAPGAKVALGLTQQTTPQHFREAVEDGSISELVAWQAVSTGDVVSVPAGTIHAIGADLIIAEIQQRSDTTYRIFDYGRERELHIESAIAVANTGPSADKSDADSTQRRTHASCLQPSLLLRADLLASGHDVVARSRRERLGFSFSVASPASVHLIFSPATPFLLNRTASTSTSVPTLLSVL